MEPSIINNFITTITNGQQGHIHRFYEIFSARGFFLELDKATEIVRLSADSHAETDKVPEIKTVNQSESEKHGNRRR